MGLFRMPSLGADMDEGTLLEWMVAPGETVERGQVIAVIDTAKSAIDAEVFEDGVVAELLVEPGTRCDVGTPLARIEPVGAPAPEPAPPLRHLMHQYGVRSEEVRPTGQQGRITRADVLAAAGHRRITPRARRLAEQRGVDLASLPSGKVVTGEDVPGDRVSSRRRATADLMARAAREIPHYYVTQDVDLTRPLEWLTAYNAGRSPSQRVLPVVLFLRATVLAAQAVPELNGHWNDGFEPASDVDLSVAVATREGGLVTPRIAGAQKLALPDLMAALAEVVRGAKSGRLKAGASQVGSITVSSLADGGPDALFGVIYPPQVAMVGVGGMAERPWVHEGVVQARTTARITLAADHRATDGRTGARFLTALGEALEAMDET